MNVSKLLTLPNGLYKLSKERKFLGIPLGKKKLFYLIVEQGKNFATMSEEDYHGFHYHIPCYAFKVKNDRIIKSWINNSFGRFVTPSNEEFHNLLLERYIESTTHLEYIGN